MLDRGFWQAPCMITYLDPRSQPAATPLPYTARWSAASDGEPNGEPIRIGLFANGFPDSVAFLGHIEAALSPLLPAGTVFVHRNKGNASAVATSEQIHGLAEQSDAVVAAYGH